MIAKHSRIFFFFATCLYTTCLLSSNEGKILVPESVRDHNEQWVFGRWLSLGRRHARANNAHLSPTRQQARDLFLQAIAQEKMEELRMSQELYRKRVENLLKQRIGILQKAKLGPDELYPGIVRTVLEETREDFETIMASRNDALEDQFGEAITRLPDVQPQQKTTFRCAKSRSFCDTRGKASKRS